MSKRPNLAAVAAAAGSTRRSEASSFPSTEAPSETSGRIAKTRMGTKQIAAHFPEDVAWQLRGLAVERKTTVQNLMARGGAD
jgi:hypothetical protein